MRKQATWIVSLCAALLALHVIGCKHDPEPVAVERVMLNMTELTLTRGETARLTAAVMPENADDKTVTWSSSDTSIATVGNDGTVTAANAGTATIYAQAGGMVTTCHVTVNPKPAIVESITLSPETLPLTVGTTGYLSAMVVYQDIPDDTATMAWQWWSSDTSVATVDDWGMITAVAEGTATITVQVGDKTATCEVTVKPVPVIAVERVTLDKNTITLTRGTGECLTATVTPDNADDRTVTWWSSDTSVATVDAWGGWVTARGVGTATIYARAGDITADCTVTVTPLLVKYITLDHDRLTLKTGQTEKVTATVTPNDADDKTILWSSSDETVATVDDDGTVTARKAGTAIITATARAGGMTKTCTAFVNPIYVNDIALSPVNFRLRPGMSRRVMATITPENADDKTILWSSSNEAVATVDDDGTVTAHALGTAARLTATITPDNADNKTVTWWSSDTSVATVDADGTVTAVGKGTATIYAQADNKTATCTVTVSPIHVESVALNTTSLTLTRGSTERLTAAITPDNADDTTVTWQSSDTSVATVGNDGTVTAHTVGTAAIIAQVGSKVAVCTVTVKPIRVENIALNAPTLTLIIGKTGKLTATVTPDNADDTTVTWSSSNTSVATVDSNGTVTAVKKGTATITAQADGKEATCAVTVKQAVENVAVNKTTLTLAVGRTEKLTATVTTDNAAVTIVTWSSSDESVATVSDDGTISAVKVGRATITAQAGGKTATCTVTVKFPTMTGGTIDENGVLTKYTGKGGTVDIPDGVTGIGESAFLGYPGITSVMIPDSVTSIGESAFYGCSGLKTVSYGGTLADWCSITWADGSANPLSNEKAVLYIGGEAVADAVIPNSVTEIKKYAFYGYANLTSVTIPNSVTSIGEEAFYRNWRLKSVTIPSSVTSIGKGVFMGCELLKSVTIPNSVTSIGEDAFWGCASLTGVMIPNSVTSIGNYAFRGCESLTSVTIPDSVTTIGRLVFSDCTILRTMTIGNGVKSIGENAFKECKNLTSVAYGGTLADWCNITWVNSAANPLSNEIAVLYIGGEAVRDAVIPNSVTLIKKYAFYRYKSLTDVTILDGVKSIGDYAFEYCTNLKSLTIPDSVTSIGEVAFGACTNLTTLKISKRLCYIGQSAFWGCTGLTGVEIPDTVTGIGNGAFGGCTGLTNVTISDSVTYIGDRAFSDCTGLTNVTIGKSVTYIGDSAFMNCTGLTNVTIPDSVTSIGGYAFYDTNFTTVTIGKGVTSIGKSAFSHTKSRPIIPVQYGGTEDEWKKIQGISESGLAYCDITFAK